MHGNGLLVLSGVLVAGFACQWLAWRVKLPSILFLLTVGIAIGPLLGWLKPNEVFGDLLVPLVSLAVAVILYEGSLTLRIQEIRGHGKVVRNLLTAGVLITWLAATFTAKWFLEWDIQLAALFGAIVTVSGPTVILPLLRSIRPTSALSNVLKWEGILIDPLGAILAVLVFNFIVITQEATTTDQIYIILGTTLLSGIILGVMAGYLFGQVLRKHWLPDYLRDYAALAMVLLVFTVAEYVASESGLLAVTIMGVWQANMRGVDLEDILDFKESLTLVLVAGLFIVLAARIDLDALISLGAGAVFVLLLLQFVAGPLRAFICSAGSELRWQERVFLGWIFPRGIVAAAVSALFALRLENLGFPGAENLVPMVFTVIIGTVVIQSLSGKLVARWLKIVNPEPTGVVIVGANPAALFYAKTLQTAGHKVLVTSMNWRDTTSARMAGVPVFFGSAVSSYADRHMSLLGLGKLLALSDQPGINELACFKFRYEFGRDSVFTVRLRAESSHEKFQVSGDSAGRLLFSGKRTLEELVEIFKGDVKTGTTDITDSFTYESYREKHPNRTILFVTSKDGHIRFPVADESEKISAGDRITALIPPDQVRN